MKKIICFLLVLAGAAGSCSWFDKRVFQPQTSKDQHLWCLDYQLDTTFHLQAEELFAYMSEWDNLAAAIPRAHFYHRNRERLEGVGDYALGMTSGITAVKVPVQITVVRWDPPRLVELAFSKTFHGTINFTLTPAGDSTRVKVSLHLFFLPDTLLGRSINNMLQQGKVDAAISKLVTETARCFKAQAEGVDPEQVEVEPPVYRIFPDTMFQASRRFSTPPAALYRRLTSPSGISTFLPFDSLEPREGAPTAPQKIGDHYRAVSTLAGSAPVSYDLVTLEFNPHKDARFYIFAHDVRIECNLSLHPTLTGSEAQVFYIVDLPPEQAGPALDVIIQTNNIDQFAQEGLDRLSSEY
jgi:carbon monoxide dehydrogenase subunit G